MNKLAILAVMPSVRVSNGGLPGNTGIIVGEAFAAMVRPSPDEGTAGRSRAELARILLENQKAVESVMAFSPVLPVKFGTLASDGDMVRDFLAEGAPLFKQAFSTLGDLVEIDVAVRWDMADTVRDVGLNAALSARLAAAVTEAERHDAGKELIRLIDERRDGIARRIIDAMHPHAADLIVPDFHDPDQVADLALLVDRTVLDQLDHTLERLDAGYSGKLSFRRIGPMPPYSFATIHVNFPQSAALERAREILGVDPLASAAEIKAAYHRSMRTIHPDLNGAVKDGGVLMTEFAEAYDALRNDRISVSLLRNPGAQGPRQCCTSMP